MDRGYRVLIQVVSQATAVVVSMGFSPISAADNLEYTPAELTLQIQKNESRQNSQWILSPGDANERGALIYKLKYLNTPKKGGLFNIEVKLQEDSYKLQPDWLKENGYIIRSDYSNRFDFNFENNYTFASEAKIHGIYSYMKLSIACQNRIGEFTNSKDYHLFRKMNQRPSYDFDGTVKPSFEEFLELNKIQKTDLYLYPKSKISFAVSRSCKRIMLSSDLRVYAAIDHNSAPYNKENSPDEPISNGFARLVVSGQYWPYESVLDFEKTIQPAINTPGGNSVTPSVKPSAAATSKLCSLDNKSVKTYFIGERSNGTRAFSNSSRCKIVVLVTAAFRCKDFTLNPSQNTVISSGTFTLKPGNTVVGRYSYLNEYFPQVRFLCQQLTGDQSVSPRFNHFPSSTPQISVLSSSP